MAPILACRDGELTSLDWLSVAIRAHALQYVTSVFEGIDGHRIGAGSVGKVTTTLMNLHSDVVHGGLAQYADWCLEA